MHRASITSDILSSTNQRINLIIIWYQLFLKLIQLKIFTLCQILGIGTRQKQPKILGTRQNLVLGSALILSKNSLYYYSILFTYLYTAPLALKTNQRRPPVR